MIESAEEFYRLRTSTVMSEYNRAAHEEAPLRVWPDVIARYPEMRTFVVHNKTVPLEILEILSSDPNQEVRWWVAMKRKLPEHLQLKLAHDPNSGVRDRIAWNAKATRSALQILAEDPDPEIRAQASARLLAGEFT